MNGIIGKGTTLGAAATSTTVVIANIMDVSTPDEKYAKVDVTEYGDTIEQYIAGWKNAGEIDFTLGWNHTSMTVVRGFLGTNNIFWKITLPLQSGQTTAGDTIAFQGCLAELSGQLPLKGKIVAKGKVFLQSDITYAAGS